MNEQPNPTSHFKLFSPPSIPHGLAFLVILLVFTHLSVLLMNQPAAYWLDSQYTISGLPFSFLLLGGPWLFLGAAVIYLLITGLLLTRLYSLAGLFLSVVLSLSHSLALYRTVLCGFTPIYEAHSAFACYSYRYVSLILFFVLFAIILLMEHLPSRMKYWGKRIAIPLAVFWILLMGYGIFRAAFPPLSLWKPLAPMHSPGPRASTAIAYDSKRHRAVLFGGITHWDGNAWIYDNSTWEWDGKDWQQIETPLAPTGRARHAMAYDEVRGVVVLYGGENTSGVLGDLWEWDGSKWHRLCPVCNPAARVGHKMVFNNNLQKIVIYGGYMTGTGFAEAWTWDGQIWSFFPFKNSAPAVYNAPLTYDLDLERTISFMGDTWGGTWIWEADAWRKLDIETQPPIRDEAVLVYDPEHDYSVLFGGVKNMEIMYNDTWILNGETWQKLNLSNGPSQRYRASAFYDPIRHSIIIYGGQKMEFINNDMWELVLPGGN